MLNEAIINLGSLSGMLPNRDKSDFTSKPWNIYILTIIVNENQKIVLSVRSDGKINELMNVENDYPSPF